MRRVWVILLVLSVLGGCRQPELQRLSLSYPEGEWTLSVNHKGEAWLAYGALSAERTLPPGSFNLEQIYRELRPHLHPIRPRQKWEDPTATMGSLHIVSFSGKEHHYQVFNQQALMDALLSRARTKPPVETESPALDYSR